VVAALTAAAAAGLPKAAISNATVDQLGREFWQSGIIAFRRVVFDCHILISQESFNFQSVRKRLKVSMPLPPRYPERQ
jgi:hypothetical protein